MINYTAIADFLNAWHTAGRDPRTPAEVAELPEQELDHAIYMGSVDFVNGEYHLISRQLIGPAVGKDMERLAEIKMALTRTMRDNAAGNVRRTERRMMTTLKAECVEPMRRFAETALMAALETIDAECVESENFSLDGVPFSVSVFQSDEG